MAKVPISRLNSAPEKYVANDFNQLIEDLQDMVKILNSTYPKDQSDEQDRKEFFFKWLTYIKMKCSLLRILDQI